MENSVLVLPVLPLRDVVVYPHMVIPLFVGREKSIKALETAMDANKRVLLVAQKSAAQDNPGTEDLYKVGTVSNILQLLKLPDGTIKVLVEGGQRARIMNFVEQEDLFTAEVVLLNTKETDAQEVEVLTRSVLNQFDQYVKLNKKIPAEIISSLSSIDEPDRLADTIVAHMSIKLDDKQKFLEIVDTHQRLEQLIHVMESEIDLLQVEQRLRGRVKRQMEKSQREYYLNEQMKAIQKELGEMDEGGGELDDLAKKIESAGMTKEAGNKARAELNKLRMMSPMSAEATVVRNYI
ncbi:MAG: LON peptidase substrate-binding domain-containing protein, partial [Gammaproteobacteria bacterium]